MGITLKERQILHLLRRGPCRVGSFLDILFSSLLQNPRVAVQRYDDEETRIFSVTVRLLAVTATNRGRFAARQYILGWSKLPIPKDIFNYQPRNELFSRLVS